MGVDNDALIDLIATTLKDLPDNVFEVMWDSQAYEFCQIYTKQRRKVDGGTSIERNVVLDETGAASYRRLFDTDVPTVESIQKKINVPWCQFGTNYSWDRLEILKNKNSAKGFVNLMKVRRVDGLWSLADLIEDRAWKTPETSTDDLYPYGVPYYLTFYSDASGTVNTSSGFNGLGTQFQDGTNTGTIANINATNEAKWRNYCAVYTSVDNAMLKAFRLAFMFTRFKVPLIITDPSQPRTAAKRVYTGFDTVADIMDLADQKDDRHTGKDVLSNLKVDDGGLCTVNRLPVIPIPQLIGADYTPVYCVDFGKFIPYVQEGYWMEEGEPMTDRGQHTTFTVFLDGAHNNLCLNRRTAGFVLHKATA